jgi:hypothetical protein
LIAALGNSLIVDRHGIAPRLARCHVSGVDIGVVGETSLSEIGEVGWFVALRRGSGAFTSSVALVSRVVSAVPACSARQ